MQTLKLWLAIITSIVAGLIPGYLVFRGWSYAIHQVPAASEWAGLIKVGISVALFPLGLGLTFWLGLLCFSVAVALWTLILE